MPKIFGDVTKLNQNLVCRVCGYSWAPNSTNKIDIEMNHRISCPICRLLKGRKIYDDIVVGKDRFKVVPKSIIKLPYEHLISDDYLSIDVGVIHLNCGASFKIKARDINEIMKCPKCEVKAPVVESKKAEANPKITEDKPDVTIGNIVETPEVIEPKTPVENEAIESTTKSAKSKVSKIISEMTGKVYNRQMMIKGIDSKGQCVCQCIHCGLENHVPVSQLTNKQRRAKVFSCSVCKDNFKNDFSYIDKLVNKYKGRVFNGLMITDVYADEEDGLTKCNCVCIRSRDQNDLNKFEHTFNELSLGDVINNRVVCSICDKGVSGDKAIAKMLNATATCKRFLDKTRLYKYGEYNYNKIGDSKKLSLEKIYLTDGKLCDFCDRQKSCNGVPSGVVDFDIIRSISDYNNNISASASDVHAKFPNIYSSTDKDAKEVSVIRDKNLQVFRDAYIGRDGRLYKFCKCITHRTEMILSESEIANFEHTQCTTECSSNLRFFNINSRYLLSNSDK